VIKAEPEPGAPDAIPDLIKRKRDIMPATKAGGAGISPLTACTASIRTSAGRSPVAALAANKAWAAASA
jgi:hypothetical protein